MQEYCDYLRAYVSHFGFWDRIKLNTKVVKISRHPDGGHIIEYVTRAADGEWESSTLRSRSKRVGCAIMGSLS